MSFFTVLMEKIMHSSYNIQQFVFKLRYFSRKKYDKNISLLKIFNFPSRNCPAYWCTFFFYSYKIIMNKEIHCYTFLIHSSRSLFLTHTSRKCELHQIVIARAYFVFFVSFSNLISRIFSNLFREFAVDRS